MNRHPNAQAERAIIRPVHLMLVLSMGFVLSACVADYPERLWLRPSGWSRAIAVGRSSTGGRPALLLEDDRAIVYLSGPRSDPEPNLVSIVFARAGEPQSNPLPALSGRSMSQPKLVRAGSEYRLYWLEDSAVNWIAWQGDPGSASQPRSVNVAGGVGAYQVVSGPDGQVSLWMAGTEDHAGLYMLWHEGISPENPIVDPQGQQPALVTDASGIYAVWLRPVPAGGQAQLVYSQLPWGSREPSPPRVVAELPVSPSDVSSGPWIGLDNRYAYVLFTNEIRTGLRAGQTDTTLHTFAVDPPGQVHRMGERLSLQPGPELDRADPAGRAAAPQEMSPWEPATGAGVTDLRQLFPNPYADHELPVALIAKLPYLRNQEQLQIAVVYLQDEQAAGSQIMTFTPAASTLPVLNSGSDGSLHLLWLERGEGAEQIVYYSSTNPAVIKALRGVTGDDLGRMATSTAFSLVSGLLFTPLALLWLIAPGIVVIATSFLREEGEAIHRRGTLITVALSVAAFWGTKLLVLPSIIRTTPFPDLYPLFSPPLASILRIAIPVIVSALALALAWGVTYRRGRHSPLFMVLMFGLTDGALTMAIYAGILIGGL